MEFTISFQPGDGPVDVEIAISGVPTPGEFRLLNERLLDEPQFRGGLAILVDLSGLETATVSSEDVEAISESTLKRDWAHPAFAVALVAPQAQRRALTGYRAHLGGSRSNREVFASREEALSWLAEARAARLTS